MTSRHTYLDVLDTKRFSVDVYNHQESPPLSCTISYVSVCRLEKNNIYHIYIYFFLLMLLLYFCSSCVLNNVILLHILCYFFAMYTKSEMMQESECRILAKKEEKDGLLAQQII